MYGLRTMPFYVSNEILKAASRYVLIIAHAARTVHYVRRWYPGVFLGVQTVPLTASANLLLLPNFTAAPHSFHSFIHLRHLPLLPSCSPTIHVFPIRSHLYHFNATTYYLYFYSFLHMLIIRHRSRKGFAIMRP